MLREYFTNRWVIGGFCFLIVFGIACYFWYQHELAPYEQSEAETAELIRQAERTQAEPTAGAPLESTTPTAEKTPLKLEDITIEWPEDADWPVNWKALYNLSKEEYAKLPQTTRDAVKRAFFAERGLTPPPEGYHHDFNKETGVWELVPNNVPIIKVKQGPPQYNQFHQLTDAEYERYTALGFIKDNQESVASFIAAGGHPHQMLAYPPEVCELAQEWYMELREKTYGPTAIATSSVYYDRPVTEADRENERHLMSEALNAATRSPQRTLRRTDVVVEEILDEIEIELGITIERESEAAKISRQWRNRLFNARVPE